MMLFSKVVQQRRKKLRETFDLAAEFEKIEESCVPSYSHPNPFAAWTAWQRIHVAADLYAAYAPAGPVLDFGAATGELCALLNLRGDYWFVEGNELLATVLVQTHTRARRVKLEDLSKQRFSAVFALDSLEHNEHVEPILETLLATLAPGGVIILSGPTENWMYRLGRRIAGFDGHYHHQTIYDIEAKLEAHAELIRRRIVPLQIPLFSVTVWQPHKSGRNG
jgi:2-polyprenyl-3-methyl-5-hydroxy-6-metoxy-1,4-benzoquinol methylase